jgi:hypothetical protein
VIVEDRQPSFPLAARFPDAFIQTSVGTSFEL